MGERGGRPTAGDAAVAVIPALAVLPDSLPGLAGALTRAGITAGGAQDALVFGPAQDSPADWGEVRTALAHAFGPTREAAAAGAPVVYLISQPALLGHAGPCPAMLAGALASGVRALAMEGRRTGVRANALTYDEDTDPQTVAGWVRALLELPGASGDLIDLGGLHHGKVRV